METLKTKVEKAINCIVSMETLPPQIDHITPAEQHEFDEACRFIESLPKGLKQLYGDRICAAIEDYHAPRQGSGGNWYSPAELDAMF